MLGDAPKLDADSIATMKTRGLTVTTLDPKAAAEFRAEAEKLVTTMRGTMVPADIYDLRVARARRVPEDQGQVDAGGRGSAPRTLLATLALGGIMLLPLAEIAMRRPRHRAFPAPGRSR